ncbi:MAG: UDP-N-acetylmuramoyl-L-alanyl-D-glutamate--2,6-diaminopimelate ligase [Candidatus Aminicenantes bacterium]|nr:UDP-N-acetylmuramoyl-L-alanyl-D-glutamate--2,6-diaminopimelate ligase [Candidatus Aminicenantes bacterium]
MRLKELFASIPQAEILGKGETEITGISYSSKEIQPGNLFAALKGEKTDGLSFVDEALANGAAAVLSEGPKPENMDKPWVRTDDPRFAMALASAVFFEHPSRELKVVGITGTKGKTTTTFILEKILQKAGLFPGVIGTISYRGPGWTAEAKRTTPESPDIQKMMRIWADNGATHCLLEVSSHSLELKRVIGIEFDVTVFTNLSGEHLDYHHSMEKYFLAKKKLFELKGRKRMAVINSDDPWGKKLIQEIKMGIITFGLEQGALIRAEQHTLKKDGIEIRLKYPGGFLNLSSSLLGLPNLYNIMAATAAALTLNISLSAIEAGVSALKSIPGRFQTVENSLGLYIFVDYSHTDAALRNALETMRVLNPGKIIVVFGAGGDRDTYKRERMGEAAGTLADHVIITNDNPRSEDPMAIISSIESGVKKSGRREYSIIPDRREAIKTAIDIGTSGDCILVAGKGHENYQIIKDKTFAFDDVEVIREILDQTGKT